jgi:hypothetical protein
VISFWVCPVHGPIAMTEELTRALLHPLCPRLDPDSNLPFGICGRRLERKDTP